MIRNITILLLLLPLFSFSQEEFIQFNCKNKYYKAQGYVNSFEFKSFSWMEQKPETIKAEILFDLNSISEKNDKLVKHLKGEDFFNIKVFPNSSLTIDSIEANSDTTYLAFGQLSIRGIQKSIALTFYYNSDRNQVVGSSTFSRYDFNINSKNKGIDENVLISFQLNLPKGQNEKKTTKKSIIDDNPNTDPTLTDTITNNPTIPGNK